MDFSRDKAKLELENSLLPLIQEDFPSHSRVHPLRTFSSEMITAYVKRDDELGFGITGAKIRKYRSLIPFLLAQGIKEVVAIGGAHSNNIVGISQLLIEKGIKPTLFLRSTVSPKLQGNALLTSLLVKDSDIHWISRSEWASVEAEALKYATSKSSGGDKVFVLREGSSVSEALPGALTLALDIIRNEEEGKIQFQDIFIEAGTGLTAISLILAYAWLRKECNIHVLLLAEEKEAFEKELAFFHHSFEELIQQSCTYPKKYTLHRPKNARSFGSVNSRIFQEIITVARDEGILIDPIYSGKLFIETKRILYENPVQGNVLLIHSGGGLALSGYGEQLETYLTNTDLSERLV
ncbi:MAG: 1-aminocyclopropane-1-carboxylate deaminase [Chlamydiales bacterium]|jgi:1-aminocyclopropane-1-carboxylate deaminase